MIGPKSVRAAPELIASYSEKRGQQESDSARQINHPKIILLSEPSILRDTLGDSTEAPPTETTISRRQKFDCDKSFIHCISRPLAKGRSRSNFCLQQTTASTSTIAIANSSVGSNHCRQKSAHSDIINNYHRPTTYQSRQYHPERVSKIHDDGLGGSLSCQSRPKSLTGSLLALSCLFLSFSLAVGTLSRTRNGASGLLNSNQIIEQDFYSPKTALSNQQQHQIPSSAIQNDTNNASQQLVRTDENRPKAKRTPRLSSVPISELDELPYSEFIIRPPAFNDLIKSWPPTTLRAAASMVDSLADRQRQQQPTGQISAADLLRKHHEQHQRDHESQKNLRSLLTRNHLNEDLDDTIVTADQSFERDQTLEPETWINYLGDLGDYIYLQLKHHLDRATSSSSTTRTASGSNKSSPNTNTHNNNREDLDDSVAESQQQQQRRSQLKMETIDELLDDYYYDQYENSQVLYYGAQLVREQEAFEIGCFLPIDQQAEWTKSGRPLPADGQSSPRTISRSIFLDAKQNFTLKVFTASLSDSGNYRCSKMSRKFHKLIVVPYGATLSQVHAIQQRLLSIVSPSKLSSANSKIYQFKRTLRGSLSAVRSQQSNQLYPGYLIVENQPLVVDCNISDIFVLQWLKENPDSKILWYKNGRQLPGSRVNTQTGVVLPSSASNQHPQRGVGSSAHSNSAPRQIGPIATAMHQPRIQFLQSGRKLFISSAQYGDAGDYLCSWSGLPARQMTRPDFADDESSELLTSNNNHQLVAPVVAAEASNDQLGALPRNPLAAGSFSQLIVPVKLRPFKSSYHLRKGNELRLVCQLQRGYPQAQISWYIGNRLVDQQFLKEHPGQYKVLYLQNKSQVSALVGPGDSERNASTAETPATNSEPSGGPSGTVAKIVEIYPIPMSRLQMQLTQDGKWVEYRDLGDEKASIDTSEQQLRYMQQKFGRLTGINISGSNLNQQSRAIDADTVATLGQMSISVLVIKSLDIERDTMRYACRATNRANTDEVTTVIRVQVRPSAGRATLIPGNNLNFECASSIDPNAEFLWFRRKLDSERDRLIEPNDDDHFEIHNRRLTLVNPSIDLVGDYYCRQLEPNSTVVNEAESAKIKVRSMPMIEDFGIETSHTGKSSTVRDGDRLELTCTVYDKLTPVNITWLRSMTSDDQTSMVALREGELEVTTTTDTPRRRPWNTYLDDFSIYQPTHYVSKNQHGIEIQTLSPFSKKLIIESVSQEHRSYYVCVADNGITERTKRVIFIRVKDRLIALWPLLGILAEFFILFTIIKIWETQRFNYTYGAASGPSSRALLASKGDNASSR